MLFNIVSVHSFHKEKLKKRKGMKDGPSERQALEYPTPEQPKDNKIPIKANKRQDYR